MSNIKLEEINQENIQGYTLKGELLNERPFSIKDAGIDSKIFVSHTALYPFFAMSSREKQ